MARVKCTCGRVYDLPAEHVGARVTCKACGRSFVATVAESPDVAEREQRPPAPATPRLGQLAIERALVSQEHVELCARVQEQLVRQGKSKKRLGEIMVEKGLLKPHQLDELLRLQADEPAEKPGPAPASPAPEPREKAEPEPKEDTPARPAAKPSRAPMLAVALLVVAGAAAFALWPRGGARRVLATLLVVAGAAAFALWPRGGARRVLATYLDSCREGGRPEAALAIGEPGLVVRRYSIEEVGKRTVHDFSAEARGLAGDQAKWSDLVAAPALSDEQRQALQLALPILWKGPAPQEAERLTVTLQPIVCQLLVKPPRASLFRQGRYRITMARCRIGDWDSGWKFARCEPAK